jgi:hypothetical protein
MATLQCPCGSTEIEVTADPIVQLYCHCGDCRTVHGAAYVPESVYPADAVRVIRGDTVAWKLKRNPRVTCATCGTRLFIDVLAIHLRGVNGTLLPKDGFRASFHMHCQEALAPVRDGLPHYKARPPQFGGSDETVDR